MDYLDDQEPDVEYSPDVIIAKLLLEFGFSNDQISSTLVNDNLKDIMNFFVNNFQSYFDGLEDIEYLDMFSDEDEELDDFIVELINFILINNVDVNLMLNKILRADPHIANKREYGSRTIRYFQNNQTQSFIQNIKYPLLNYIYFLFLNYNRYENTISDLIENIVEDEEEFLQRQQNIEYDIQDDIYGSDVE